jgi:hypothetical protein
VAFYRGRVASCPGMTPSSEQPEFLQFAFPVLRGLLPAEARRVLLIAEKPAEAASAFAQSGLEATPARELPAAGEVDAVVLLDGLAGSPPERLKAILERAHALLAERGRVLAVTAPGGPGPRELTIALSEAAFAIVKQVPLEIPGEPRRQAFAGRRDEYLVREYRQGDEHQILPIFHGSFYVERSPERWRWEYAENPYGNRTISEAFTRDGQLVAHYAGYPVRFWSDTGGEPRSRTALQIGDTMTLPSVRGVGRGPTSLLARTLRHFYARYCEGRVAFNYGFNTGNIQRFSLAFAGARRLEDVPYFERDAGLPLPGPGRLRALLSGLRVERVTSVDGRWDEFFQRVRGGYRCLIERDARYLDWRYLRCPDAAHALYAVFHRGRLAGWSVFRRRSDRLLWGDALFDLDRPEAARAVLAHALAEPENRGVRTVAAWVTDRPAAWRRLMEGLGFERRPEPDDLGYMSVPFEEDPEEDFRAHLYYTMGDGDLF